MTGEEYLRRLREGSIERTDRTGTSPISRCWLHYLTRSPRGTVLLVPCITKSPEEAFRSVQNQLNAVLNKVLTEYRLQLLITGPRRTRAVLAFLDRHRQPIGVPLRGSSWYLSLQQELQALPRRARLSSAPSAVCVSHSENSFRPGGSRSPFRVCFPIAQPDFPYSRHHVQFHRDSRSASSDFSLSKFHIPTGRVTIEHIIRFLIADLGVPPLVENWDEVLRESEKVMQDWLSDVQQA